MTIFVNSQSCKLSVLLFVIISIPKCVPFWSCKLSIVYVLSRVHSQPLCSSRSVAILTTTYRKALQPFPSFRSLSPDVGDSKHVFLVREERLPYTGGHVPRPNQVFVAGNVARVKNPLQVFAVITAHVVLRPLAAVFIYQFLRICTQWISCY